MKRCEYCGYRNPEENTVCEHCGKPLNNTLLHNTIKNTDIYEEDEVWRPDRKKGKKQIFLVTGVCTGLLATAIGIGGYFVYQRQQRETYYRQVSYANQYMESQNYEDAMEAFLLALDMDDRDEDAYIGLYRAYCAMGQYDYALDILRKGEKKTDSKKIHSLLQSYMDIREGAEKSTVQKNSDQTENGKETEMNTQLLFELATFNYKNYYEKYGDGRIVQNSDESLSVDFEQAGITVIFRNSDETVNIDSGRNIPYDEALPETVSFSSMDSIFSDYTGSLSLEEIEMMNGGNVRKEYNEEAGSNVLVIKRGTVVLQIACNEEGTVSGEAPWNRMEIPAVTKEQEDRMVWIQGKIVDAVSGRGVGAAALEFSEPEASEPLYYAVTDSDGNYQLQIAEGNYECLVKKEGYKEETFPLEFIDSKNQIVTMDEMVVIPELQTEEIRIVLSWGQFPRDLDSHLAGTLTDGQNIYVYFGEKQFRNEAGEISVQLDRDDRDGFGPETITIRENGSFHFKVRDFTLSGRMAESEAVVKIYKGNEPNPYVFQVPQGEGNIWDVCTIENGEIIEINQIRSDS